MPDNTAVSEWGYIVIRVIYRSSYAKKQYFIGGFDYE